MTGDKYLGGFQSGQKVPEAAASALALSRWSEGRCTRAQVRRFPLMLPSLQRKTAEAALEPRLRGEVAAGQ